MMAKVHPLLPDHSILKSHSQKATWPWDLAQYCSAAAPQVEHTGAGSVECFLAHTGPHVQSQPYTQKVVMVLVMYRHTQQTCTCNNPSSQEGRKIQSSRSSLDCVARLRVAWAKWGTLSKKTRKETDKWGVFSGMCPQLVLWHDSRNSTCLSVTNKQFPSSWHPGEVILVITLDRWETWRFEFKETLVELSAQEP